MFLKREVRRKDGKEDVYYCLAESTRVGLSGSASGKAKRCYGECKSSWWRSKSPLILNDGVPVRIAANGTRAKLKAASR